MATIRRFIAISALLWFVLATGRAAAEEEWRYILAPGDSVWRIVERHMPDMRYLKPLVRLNRLATPDMVPAGGELRLPMRWLMERSAVARVVGAAGTALRRASADAAAEAVAPGDRVTDGAVLETGADGSLVLEFADGARLLLEAGSRLRIARLRAYGDGTLIDTRLELEVGRARSTVAPVTPGRSRFEIWTRPGISAVRGTGFRTAFAPAEERMTSEVLEGTVEVSAAARTVEVPTGFGTRVRSGEAPQPPVPLLPAPEIERLPEPVARIPLQLRVRPVPGAVAYRLELAADARFEPVLVSRLAAGPVLSAGTPADGRYHVRVRAVDASGLEGLESESRLVLDARPEPPVLLRPGRSDKVREPRPVFDWARPEGARRFHFELGSGERVLLATEVESPPFTLAQPLAEGRYWWRVATVDGAGERGPFSDPGSFERLDPLQVADLAAAERHGQLQLSWRAGPPGTRYRVQLARTADFADPLIDRVVDAPQLALPRPSPGRYYLRVRAVEADGYEGPFSPVQQLTVEPTTLWPTAAAVLLGLLLLLL